LAKKTTISLHVAVKQARNHSDRDLEASIIQKVKINELNDCFATD